MFLAETCNSSGEKAILVEEVSMIRYVLTVFLRSYMCAWFETRRKRLKISIILTQNVLWYLDRMPQGYVSMCTCKVASEARNLTKQMAAGRW